MATAYYYNLYVFVVLWKCAIIKLSISYMILLEVMHGKILFRISITRILAKKGKILISLYKREWYQEAASWCWALQLKLPLKISQTEETKLVQEHYQI